jgi:hypothetical protein
MLPKRLISKDMFMREATGIDRITDDSRQRILHFIKSRQLECGGFCGRSSTADLYYTFFAMSIIAAMDGDINIESLAHYLDLSGRGENLDFIHLACLIRCRAIMGDAGSGIIMEQCRLLEQFRSDDGGYQQSGKGALSGSVYACFIAWLTYKDAGEEMPNYTGLDSCLQSFKLNDGSYANDLSVKSGSTTATAAAVVLLSELGVSTGDDTVVQLLSRAVAGGGFIAGDDAPIPDLLSTATALYAIKRAGHDIGVDIDVHHNYVASLWNEDGGFAGNTLDSESDCEYTYYALLALG